MCVPMPMPNAYSLNHRTPTKLLVDYCYFPQLLLLLLLLPTFLGSIRGIDGAHGHDEDGVSLV